MNENAQLITETVTRIQKELKCGICCSTFKDPIISTCFHVFCRECIEACFAKKRKLQCPICRQILDKRSCKDSYQHTQAVQNYLKLSDAFKEEIKKLRSFTALPPEVAFFESQVPLDVTIIPENDGKRVAPDFLMPYLPTRRKRVSKPITPPIPPEQPDFQSPTPPTSSKNEPKLGIRTPKALEIDDIPTTSQAEVKKTEENVKKPLTTSIGCHAKPIIATWQDLTSFDLEKEIRDYKDSSQKNCDLDDIEALFNVFPSSKPFLQNNIRLLMRKFGIVEMVANEDRENDQNTPKMTKRKSSEKRVTFGRIQEVVEAIQNSDEIEENRVENEPAITPENEKPTGTISDEIVADSEGDNDEVVADSEGEEVAGNEKTVEGISEETPKKSRLSEIDATFPFVQNESAIIAEDLGRTPLVIACSRMSNDKDEELCSDFFSHFLSNSCRFSDEVTAKTTHLVMMNSVGRTIPQKSLAYVFAIAHKCIIVNRDWLIDCVKHKVVLDATGYTIDTCPPFLSSYLETPLELNDPKSFGPARWQAAREWTGPKLFQGYFFIIIRKYTWTNVLDYRKVIDLVNLCGGEIYSDYQSARPPKLFFVCAAQTPVRSEAVRMEREFKCPVVTCEWILDCISEFKILPHDDYLTKNAHVDWKMYE